MTDIYDQATEREERDRELAIKVAATPVLQMPFTGYCYNCEELISQHKHFCDADCRDDWQLRQKLNPAPRG